MKFTVLVLCFICTFTHADDDCTFDQNVFESFRSEYIETHSNASLDKTSGALLVKRAGKTIIVNGGGCHDLGVSIEASPYTAPTEDALLKEVLSLSEDFSSWLINTQRLRQIIDQRRWKKLDKAYVVRIDEMTYFETYYNATYNTIHVNAYIN